MQVGTSADVVVTDAPFKREIPLDGEPDVTVDRAFAWSFAFRTGEIVED